LTGGGGRWAFEDGHKLADFHFFYLERAEKQTTFKKGEYETTSTLIAGISSQQGTQKGYTS